MHTFLLIVAFIALSTREGRFADYALLGWVIYLINS